MLHRFGRSIFLLLFLLLAAAGGSRAYAVVLDWDAVTWTPGLSNSFDVDGTAGNDLTVTVAGSTGALQFGTPAIATQFSGGLTPVAPATAIKTLAIGVDFTDATSQFITVTVDFSALYTQGVENVSFTIFDVDYESLNGSQPSRYEDQLRSITGTSIGGTSVAPTITTSANNLRTGTGLSQVVTGRTSTIDSGAGSGAANVTISFGTSALKSFTFTYGGGTAFADPTYQHIGLYDISFTPVPEINPAFTAALSCFAAGGLMFLHRARVKSRRQ